MKRILIAVLLMTACALPGAAPKRGKERLRELVVIPTVHLEPGQRFMFRGGLWTVTDEHDLQPGIERVRQLVKTEPENITELVRLGMLLRDAGETNAAHECFITCEQITRRNVESRPLSGYAWTRLGYALWGLQKNDEAESAFRKGISLSSDQWGCWFGLGRFLAEQSSAALLPPGLRSRLDFFVESSLREALDYRPPAESLSRGEALNREALLCFDRAIALATNRPGLYLQRGGNRCFSDWKDYLIQHIRNQDAADPAKLRAAFFSTAAIADFRRSAELDPQDYRSVVLPAWFEAARVAMQNPSVTFETLPDETRQSMRQAMTRLEDLAAGPDKVKAAGACEMLASLNVLAHNLPAARENSRRAVALDKRRETSWDMWIGLSLESSTPAEVVALCESRLKQKKSAHNYLLLAKALTRQEKWDDAAKQATRAVNLDTNNIVGPLLVAAIALKQSGSDPLQLDRAGRALTRADALLDKMPPGKETQQRWYEHRINTAIGLGLGDQTDRAKTWLNNVLKYFPNDKTAQAVLEALE